MGLAIIVLQNLWNAFHRINLDGWPRENSIHDKLELSLNIVFFILLPLLSYHRYKISRFLKKILHETASGYFINDFNIFFKTHWIKSSLVAFSNVLMFTTEKKWRESRLDKPVLDLVSGCFKKRLKLFI